MFKGKGKFKRTLEFVGCGYIPLIFSGIIGVVLYYNFFSTAQIPVVTDPAEMAEVLTEAVVPLLKSPTIIRLLTLVGIFFTLWSTYGSMSGRRSKDLLLLCGWSWMAIIVPVIAI